MISKKIIKTFLLLFLVLSNTSSLLIANAQESEQTSESESINYLKSVISTDNIVEIKKSTIFDASQSFIPDSTKKIKYEWNFGDGNKNEGIEVLHSYTEPGDYIVTLTVSDGITTTQSTIDVFAYKKLLVLITDKTEDQERIKIIQEYSEKKGVYLKIVESFGSGTEFISEEILTKKINEEANYLQKAKEILIWTRENAGLNALSRFIQNKKDTKYLEQKTIIVLNNDLEHLNRVQNQYDLIRPKNIIVTKEGSIDIVLDTTTDEEFISALKEVGGYYKIINSESGKIRPWNFMSYFVNILIDNGIPDNTISLLLLLPVIATVIAFMRQVIGITTYGVYTPTIITLSFLIIGVHAGLLTLLAAIIVGITTKLILKKVNMLFIPKMAIVLTLVSLTLLLMLISGIYLNLYDATFISIAIFPMLILSTLVEKFVSTKTDAGFSSTTILMGETLFVAIVAYFIAGGEIDLGFTSFKFDYVKTLMLNYPEIVILLIVANIGLGKWSGLRVVERIRFREILKHIEE
ncbi:MAG: 7TM domain-containing protein [Patescibacteria group bacterium]